MGSDNTLLKLLVDFVNKRDDKLNALQWCVFELADQIDKLNQGNVVVEKKTEVITRDEVSDQQGYFMTRFGWEFPGGGALATKHEHITGKVLAHEGDETWTRDLKVAGE